MPSELAFCTIRMCLTMLSPFFMQSANPGFIISVIVISKIFYSPEMVYLLSGAKFGFPQRKVLPENLLRKCRNQDWSGLQIWSGLVEWNGVFAQEHFVENTPLCNYGGV